MWWKADPGETSGGRRDAPITVQPPNRAKCSTAEAPITPLAPAISTVPNDSWVTGHPPAP